MLHSHILRATLRSARIVAIALPVLLAPGACSSSSASNAGPAPVARFQLADDTPPNVLDVPFPSDVYLANGHLIELPGLERLVPINSKYISHAAAKANGFGQASFALFYVDDPAGASSADDGGPAWADVDPASLPVNEDACVADTSAVFLIDLAPADASKARIRCRGQIHDDSAVTNARPVVGVGPGLGIVLEEAHPYAAVLTSRVRDAHGRRLAASADFKALLAGTRTGASGALYGGAIDKARAAIGAALATDQSDIVAIAPFTTMSITAEMFKLRESLDAMPVPTLAWDAPTMAPMGATKFAAASPLPTGFTASLDDWLGVAPKLGDGSDDPDYLETNVLPHDRIAAIGTAVFQAANFLITKPGGYNDLDHASFARDGSGAIVPAPDRPTVPVWVSFAIPTSPMPAGGYPCVIVAHGLPGSRADLFIKLANTLTAKGWIVAGIDFVTNGARAVEAKYRVDQVTDWQMSPGAKYAGPDGISDNLDGNGHPSPAGGRAGNLDMFGQGIDFDAARDQPRQVAIDVSQLARLLANNPDLSPLATGGTTPKIDGTKLAYIGGSFGAITGAVAAAIEPLVKTWVLNVGGGHLFLTSHAAPGTQATLKAAALTLGVTSKLFIEETTPLFALGQVVFGDPWDPLPFARNLVSHPGSIHGTPLAPRNVLAIEALYDALVANDATESWARAMGIGMAVPNVGTSTGIATMDQVRDPTKVPDRLTLFDVNPDATMLIHDTPFAGITSVLVQTSPGTHYLNLTVSKDTRVYPLPYNADTLILATEKQIPVREPYLETQAMVVRYIADAFAGGVPNVTGFKPPVRDFDDDGAPDATDADPNDPRVK
jgi:hypothetical protein